MNQDRDNPYRSPETADFAPVVIPIGDAGQIKVTAVIRSWVRRRIQVEGLINGTIEYNARGFAYERVLLDGDVVLHAQNLNFLPFLMTPLHFEIDSDTQSFSAKIDVRGILRVWAFRLWIEDTLIYSEGSW